MSLFTGPGPEQRDVDDEVAEGLGPELADQLALARATRSGSSRGCGSTGSARRSPGRRAAPGRSSRSIRSSPSTRATSSTAWAIADCIRMPSTSSLSRPSVLDVVLVELAHREAQPARLDRGAVEQGGVGQQHAARVQRDVPGQPVEPLDQAGTAGRAGRRPAARRAARAARRSARRASRARMCGNALAIASISPGGMPSAAPTSRIGVPHPVGVHHRHAGDPLAAEALEDLLVDLGAAGGLDVDVDVGQRVAQRREEPLHQQAVRDRVDAGDAEQVVDQAAGARAARGDPDPHVADQVARRRRR